MEKRSLAPPSGRKIVSMVSPSLSRSLRAQFFRVFRSWHWIFADFAILLFCNFNVFRETSDLNFQLVDSCWSNQDVKAFFVKAKIQFYRGFTLVVRSEVIRLLDKIVRLWPKSSIFGWKYVSLENKRAQMCSYHIIGNNLSLNFGLSWSLTMAILVKKIFGLSNISYESTQHHVYSCV